MLRKIIISLIIAAISFSLFSFATNAFELDKTQASAEAYLLWDVKNDLIMAEENADKSISPASTAKIMTACIVLEAGIDLDLQIEITSKMLQNVSGRNMELALGDRLTAKDLLYAMLCGGFNDATVALALTVSSSLYEFAELMNEKAQELGMAATRYTSPVGIEASAAKTTARDIAILAKYMSKNECFVEICSTKFYRFSDSATSKYTSVNNRSPLLSSYKGASNFNTGSSQNGDCAVIYYKTEECELISIVMNASASDEKDTSNYAEIDTQSLISHALNDYSLVTVKNVKEPIASLSVNYSISSDKIDLYLAEDVKLFLSNEIDINTDLTYEVNIFGGELKAPLKKGDKVGELTVYLNGKSLSQTAILSSATVERNSFLYALDMMRSFITSIWFVMILAIIAICIFWLRSRKKRKFRKKKHKSKNKSKKLKNNSKTP